VRAKKVKLSLCLITEALCHKDVSASGDIAPQFFTSEIYEVEWSASQPGRFFAGKEPPVRVMEETGWAQEPVWTLCIREKSLALTRNRTTTVQPVARRYFD
jgi:hypothetical protein